MDGTFAINGSESLTDFGYRAVHLTTVYSQKIIEVSPSAQQSTGDRR